MTLEECSNSKEITGEYETLDIKVDGIKHTVSIGETYGRLQIIKLVRYIEGKVKRKGCICKCSCGNYKGISNIRGLFNGELISCGCYSREVHSKLMKEKNFKHGESTRKNRSKLYIIWGAMIDRTSNPNRNDSEHYYSKGIRVCEEWKDYVNFKEWALNNGYEEGLSIDRIENDKGYNPSNCRWVKLEEQNRNKTNNKVLEYNGEKHIITEWCRITGLNWSTIDRRLKRGLSVGQALGYEK